jgi:site-specific DNA recombinase
MTRSILYARFSPRPDADESQSCEQQRAACTRYCAAKGYSCVDKDYYEDRSASGDDADRPGLWAAIGALRRGNVLVVRWRSRLARDVYLAEHIRRAVETAGARIEAAEEQNGETPDDRFIQQILAAFAEREKRIIAIRTKYAMLRHQRNGRYMGGEPPYGWRTEDGRLLQDPDEQHTLGYILEMRERGVSLREIAERLGLKGRPARGGGAWSHGSVAKILRRQAAGFTPAV